MNWKSRGQCIGCRWREAELVESGKPVALAPDLQSPNAEQELDLMHWAHARFHLTQSGCKRVSVESVRNRTWEENIWTVTS